MNNDDQNSNLAEECRTDSYTEREGYRGDHIAQVELDIFKLDILADFPGLTGQI